MWEAIVGVLAKLKGLATLGSQRESGSVRARDINARNVAGRDQNVYEAKPDPLANIPWQLRPDHPDFTANVSINPGPTVGGRIGVEGANVTFEYRWTGAGAEHDWSAPKRGSERSGAPFKNYELDDVALGPQGPPDELNLQVRFYWGEGLHKAAWRWTVLREDSGHWYLQDGRASRKPSEFD